MAGQAGMVYKSGNWVPTKQTSVVVGSREWHDASNLEQVRSIMDERVAKTGSSYSGLEQTDPITFRLTTEGRTVYFQKSRGSRKLSLRA